MAQADMDIPNAPAGTTDSLRSGRDGAQRSTSQQSQAKVVEQGEASSESHAGARRSKTVRGVKRREVILFANQLSVMIDTGVPIAKALEAIARRTANPKFRQVLDSVNESLQAGQSLSRSLAQYPKVFPPIMIALLRASEASGAMDVMLNRIAIYLNRENQILTKKLGEITCVI